MSIITHFPVDIQCSRLQGEESPGRWVILRLTPSTGLVTFLPLSASHQVQSLPLHQLRCWAICPLSELNQLTKLAAKVASHCSSELIQHTRRWVKSQTWHKGGDGNTQLEAEDGRIKDGFLQGCKQSQGTSPSIKSLYQNGNYQTNDEKFQGGADYSKPQVFFFNSF